MVEDHPHGVLKVFELLGVNDLHLVIGNFTFLDQREQEISCKILNTQIELLRNLTLLETLVDPSDVLPESAVVIILDAIVRPTVK